MEDRAQSQATQEILTLEGQVGCRLLCQNYFPSGFDTLQDNVLENLPVHFPFLAICLLAAVKAELRG